MYFIKKKKYKQNGKGKGKTIMEQISDNGLFNKDYPDINNKYNYSKETQSALKILNSDSSNFNSKLIKGGTVKKYYKRVRSTKSKTNKNKTIKKKYKKI